MTSLHLNTAAVSDEIDAVITWVDGNDPIHRAKRLDALQSRKSHPVNSLSSGISECRFSNNNELYFCMRSIRTFMPWIRKIHLVTDNQRPEFLTEELAREWRVILVDHEDIFSGYGWALPTFNSRTIETMLHIIEDLAHRYIYFNDDMVITRPIPIEKFFEKGSVILRGEFIEQEKFGNARRIFSQALNYSYDLLHGKQRSMNKLSQQTAANELGFHSWYFASAHTPYPIIRENLVEFLKNREDLVTKNISYKFRDMRQFTTTALCNHIQIKRGEYLLDKEDDYEQICFNRDTQSQIERKINRLAKGELSIVCLQNLEQSPTHQSETIIKELRDLLVT